MNKYESHINHSKLEFSCDAGNASVNVFTGRLLFEYLDMTVGMNSYAMGISHVFDSRAFNGINTFMGSGWKLNIQQYVFKGNDKDENGEYLYRYIDAYGYIYEFEKYGEDGDCDIYFDRSGSGMTLYIGNGKCYIEDSQRNIMHFETGSGIKKLNKVVSGLNDEICKIIEFNSDGSPKSMYDGRRSDRKITFEYKNGLLSAIRCASAGYTVKYAYDKDNNITAVEKIVNSYGKYTVAYSYEGKLLKYAVAVDTGSCLKFIYDDAGRAVNVTDGVMRTNLEYSDAYDALFTGMINCNGKYYCGQKERRVLGYSVSGNDEDFGEGVTRSGIRFGAGYTAIKNGKGVETVYYFNEKGFTVGMLERSGTNSYKTLFRDTGVSVFENGNVGNEVINGNIANEVKNKYYFSAKSKNAFKSYTEKEANKEVADFVLSFWVRLASNQASVVKAKLCADCDCLDTEYIYGSQPISNSFVGERVIASATLDHTVQNGWQYVSIPFSTAEKSVKRLNGDKGYFIDRTKFNDICHIEFEGVSGSVYIADVRITAGPAPKFYIKEGAEDSATRILLDDVTAVSFYNKEHAVNEEFFMTESDVMLTAMEMCKERSYLSNTRAPFTLICNGGTKRYSKVYEVSFIANGYTVPLNAVTVKDKFILNEYNMEYTLYRPSLLRVTGAASDDNVSETYPEYHFEKRDSKPILDYTRTYTRVKSGSKSSEEYSWQDAFGRSFKSCDAYGVMTDNSYDEYGNLIKTAVSGKDTTERIVDSYTYDANKECLITTQDGAGGGAASRNYTSDALHCVTLTSSQGAKNKSSYTYNGFYDRIKEVKLEADGIEYGKNTIKYGNDGRISSLSPADGVKYGIKYDRFGRVSEFSLNGNKLLSKEYDYENNSVTAKYYKTGGTYTAVKTWYDKYGRIQGMTSDGAGVLSLTYEDEAGGFAESPSCANISRYTDGCTGETYRYEYDEFNGRPKKYTVTSGDVEVMSAQCIGDNKILFKFDRALLEYEEEIIYDKECFISPRIWRVSNNNIAGMEWTFGYDGLGRYNHREDTGLSAHHPKLDITYKSGTLLKESIKYSGSLNQTITHAYDARGNVEKTVSQKGGDTETTEYTYDGVNRLVKEVNGGFGITREYEYDAENNIKSVKQTNDSDNGVITDTYEYSEGRLTKVRENGSIVESYKYDNYGNPTHFKSATQNMWWERGTLLSRYNNIYYTYDAYGKLTKKQAGRVARLYYDGDRLIAMEIGGEILRFFYDIEGVAGFKKGAGARYTYVKDGQGNVLGLADEDGLVAKYIYDAWGQCKAADANGNEITDQNSAALLNPFRWKSQYYDEDSGLYYIEGRWYDPEHGRYISSDSPENLLSNAATVFALNLYALCVTNPLAVAFAVYTIMPSLDFYYDGEYKTWWEKWGRWILFGIGVVATIAAVIAAPFTCGASSPLAAIGATLLKIAIGTAIGTAVALAIGGTMAGLQSMANGGGFWEAFADYASENFVDALITSFALTAVTIAASNITKCFQCFKEGTLVETEEGLKPIEEIREGDKVLAYDEATGEQAYKPVVQLFRNTTNEWYHIHVNSEEIVCTGGHPFYVVNTEAGRNKVDYEGRPENAKGAWICANELQNGDKLQLANGNVVAITAIQVEKLSTPETTYNFEVADSHTYYVSDSKILVHNDCIAKPKMANRGSTGRTEPDNLVEKLAMEQVKSDPLSEAKIIKNISLKDQRWLSSDGWVKMQSVVRSGSHQTTIHFVYNQSLNLVDDFKFVAFKTIL